MSTIKSDDSNITINASGSGRDIKFQANGVEKASIDSSGNLTVSGNLTSVGIDDNADATAITIDSSENVIIGASSFDQGGFSGSATGINVHGVSPLVLCKETDTNIRGYVGVAGGDMYVMTPDSANLYIGTNDAARMTIDNNGIVTKPNQPAFAASLSSGHTSANNTTIVFNSVRHNIGSHYNSSTGIFTAPVAGIYSFKICIMSNNTVQQNKSYSIRKNGSIHQESYSNSNSNNHHKWNWSGDIQLSASDTILVNTGSCTLYGAAGQYSLFSGHLIG